MAPKNKNSSKQYLTSLFKLLLSSTHTYMYAWLILGPSSHHADEIFNDINIALLSLHSLKLKYAGNGVVACLLLASYFRQIKENYVFKTIYKVALCMYGIRKLISSGISNCHRTNKHDEPRNHHH